MTSRYNGLEFRTRLEAQWAAFFDLANWHWWQNPVAVGNWKPDFKVEIPCSHSECSGSHTILVAILPFSSKEKFQWHPCLEYCYKVEDSDGAWLADAGAAFGEDPSVTQWEMSHGAGGGVFDVEFWVSDADSLWSKAASQIR